MKYTLRHNSVSASPARHYWLACLLACVLWAQFLGISHRYAHTLQVLNSDSSAAAASNRAEFSTLWWDSQSPPDESKLHSCLLFDAATCGDQIAALAELLIPSSKALHLASPLLIHNWLSTPELAFLSRAPPALA